MIFIYSIDTQTNHMDRKRWSMPCEENLGISGFSIIKDATTISELLHFFALAPCLTNLNAGLSCNNSL